MLFQLIENKMIEQKHDNNEQNYGKIDPQVLGTEKVPLDTHAVLMTQEEVNAKWGLEGAQVAAKINIGAGLPQEEQREAFILTDGADGVAVAAEIEGRLEMVPLSSGGIVTLGRKAEGPGEQLNKSFDSLRVSASHLSVERNKEGVVTVATTKEKTNLTTYTVGEVPVSELDETTMPNAKRKALLAAMETASPEPNAEDEQRLGLYARRPDVAAAVDTAAKRGGLWGTPEANADSPVIEHETAEEESAEEEPQLEKDPDVILRDHFDALIDGTTEIEGVDPEIIHELKTELKKTATFWRYAQSETKVGEISGTVSEKIKQLTGEGQSLNEIARGFMAAEGNMQALLEVCMRLENAYHQGDLEYATSIRKQYIDFRGYMPVPVDVKLFDEIEQLVTRANTISQEVEEADKEAKRIKSAAEDTTFSDEEKVKLKALGSIGAIKQEALTGQPKVDKLRHQVNSIYAVTQALSHVKYMQVDAMKAALIELENGFNEFEGQFGRGDINFATRASILRDSIITKAQLLAEQTHLAMQLVNTAQRDVFHA